METTKETPTETFTRTALGDGRYRYESDLRGVIYKASKVFYTHVARFAPITGHEIVTFHKTEAAAIKTRGATGFDGPYWTKLGHTTIIERTS